MKSVKKIKNFLCSPAECGSSEGGYTLSTAVLPGLRLLNNGAGGLCVTLPDAQSADRFCEDAGELLRLAGLEKRMLMIPECGRGKLLFPGGEARRARALNRILNEKFDLIIGSVHAWLGPAPLPRESADGELELRCADTACEVCSLHFLSCKAECIPGNADGFLFG